MGNAVAESFFATLKVELVHEAAWDTRTTARTELFDYIDVSTTGSDDIRRLGTSVPGRSSGGKNRKH